MERTLSPYFSKVIGDEYEFGLFLAITIAITLVVLIFGEFIPKTLFRLYSDDILYFLAYPLRLFQWLLAPIAWMMIQGANLILISLLNLLKIHNPF